MFFISGLQLTVMNNILPIKLIFKNELWKITV